MTIRRTPGAWFAVGLIAALNLIIPAGRAAAQTATPPASVSPSSRAITAVSQQPLRFDALGSEGDGKSGFISRGSGYAMVLTPGSVAVSLADQPGPSSTTQATPTRTLAVRMTWPGARRNVHPVGTDLAAGVTNYLIGSDPSQWRRGVQSFGKVRYPALYPGIDLVFYGNQKQLEYDFVVAPGGDPKNIRLRISGDDALRIDANGNLVIRAGSAEMVQRAPLVYQEHDGTRHLVAGRYVKTGRHEVRFAVGDYDRTRTLSIDPVLTYSSYFGGNNYNYAQAVAVDSAGSAYVTGYTASTNFPTTPGAYLTSCGDCGLSNYVFVTKISATGVLVYSTYVGTNNTQDKGYAIAVDSAGNAYVAGDTSYPGTGVSFPVVGGFNMTGGGGAFLFKLNSTGSSLLYSTLMKRNGIAYGVAVEGSNAYVVGSGTLDSSFPLYPMQGTPTFIGPIGGSILSSYDAFVLKIDTNQTGLASLVYYTIFGGTDLEEANGVAVNSAGEAYVTGATTSADFPTTSGAAQSSCGTAPNCNGRTRDVFVAKFNATGTGLVYSTFVGGSNREDGYAIAIDALGNAYVAGQTYSTDFPTVGALKTTLGSFGSDGFVFKLNSMGTGFVYSTFLGGASSDTARAIAVDSAFCAYVAGDTYSADFPTVNAIQPLKADTNTADAFVSRLNPTGSALVYSSYLGGSGGSSPGDKAFGIALDSAGDYWVVGQTDSTDFPVKAGAIQLTHGGGQFDGFVVKIGDPLSVTSVLPTSGSTAGGTAVTVRGTGFMSGATVTFGGAAATALSVLSPTTITVSAPAHALGAVDIVVTSLDGRIGTLAGGFTYVTRPALTFTDDPLQSGITRVKAVHMTELRTAVNALRSRYALTNFSFTDGTLTPGVTVVKGVHLLELRTALAQVYTAASRTVPTWNPGAITLGTVVTAAQITELRTATRALW